MVVIVHTFDVSTQESGEFEAIMGYKDRAPKTTVFSFYTKSVIDLLAYFK